MLKDMFDFLAARGLLSPSILAAALLGVVYFQSGVDSEQRKSIDELHEQQRITAVQQADTAASLKATAMILQRIDELGTRAEMQHREKEMDHREEQDSRRRSVR